MDHQKTGYSQVAVPRDAKGALIPAANHPYFEAAFKAARTNTFRAAVSARLTRPEREDLYQELWLELLERGAQFNPDRGGPGTFTGLVTHQRITRFLKALNEDSVRLTLFSTLEPANDDVTHEDEGPLASAVPMWALEMDRFLTIETLCDLQTAVAHMNDGQFGLFQLLIAHQDLPSAAKASLLSSASFYRQVADLLMHLRMFGIRAA